ncbi:DUF3164 family protein [Phenylobacterium sp.]|uniref:DUF3164 family protein n=1 Tax=Phenylobacterium sp. TaxID=1871053 RepID=UPI00391A5A76
MNPLEEAHHEIDAELAAPAIPPGVVEVNGKPYLTDPKGTLVPLEAVKTQHRLEDEVVRKIVGYAAPLSAQIARFREHTFDDVDQFVALLEQHHGLKRGGRKGNIVLTTFDGLQKIIVQVADQIEFGAELQVAKGLVDECLTEWSAESRTEIRAIVQRAFNVDKGGLINRAELFSLLRLEIEDERWQRAMTAIRESIRVVGSKRYVRIYHRAKATDAWALISLDAATA